MTVDFTLVLDRAPTDDELDAFYEGGLQDSLFEYGAGQSLAHVTREADSAAAAVLSAISQIKSVGFSVLSVESEML